MRALSSSDSDAPSLRLLSVNYTILFAYASTFTRYEAGSPDVFRGLAVNRTWTADDSVIFLLYARSVHDFLLSMRLCVHAWAV